MILSYGHKFGRPASDKDFDVRTLTHDTTSDVFKSKLLEIVAYGRFRPQDRIAIGCEKGQHRSVVLAHEAAKLLRTSVLHRDRNRK